MVLGVGPISNAEHLYRSHRSGDDQLLSSWEPFLPPLEPPLPPFEPAELFDDDDGDDDSDEGDEDFESDENDEDVQLDEEGTPVTHSAKSAPGTDGTESAPSHEAKNRSTTKAKERAYLIGFILELIRKNEGLWRLTFIYIDRYST